MQAQIADHVANVLVAFIGMIGTLVTALLAWSIKKQSLRNNQVMQDIHGKVNGELERRIKEVQRAKQLIPPQILIVDDSPTDCELIGHVLKSFSAKVFSAVNAITVRAMIEQRIAPGRGYPFDLILVDWNLQGSDATEVLQVCTGLASGVPVVIMTGHITHSLQVALQKGGPLMFLLKPITADNIVILFRQFQIPFVRESDVDRKKQS